MTAVSAAWADSSLNTSDMTDRQITIKVGESTELTATLADNSSASALMGLLANGPVTVDMHDYANMEKVGSLPESLPSNDTYFTTGPGDLVLYLGNQFVIYYDTNSYNFTRLGKINGNYTGAQLKSILGNGNGNVTVTLSAGAASGVEDVAADDSAIEKSTLYNLSSQRICGTPKGIYVARTPRGTTKKIKF